ncbi:hypothetical protein BC940DRAFT_336148 [Gongronella butleri]|nr:hypothetical protein BC940DRAFT_336148 [Gongronella butleri]
MARASPFNICVDEAAALIKSAIQQAVEFYIVDTFHVGSDAVVDSIDVGKTEMDDSFGVTAEQLVLLSMDNCLRQAPPRLKYYTRTLELPSQTLDKAIAQLNAKGENVTVKKAEGHLNIVQENPMWLFPQLTLALLKEPMAGPHHQWQ